MSEVNRAEAKKALRPRGQSQLSLNARRFMRMPLAVFGAVVVLLIVLCAIFAPFISPYDPNYQSKHYLSPPSKEFLLGTDQIGRDVLSRTIFGSRIALLVSVGAVGLGVFVGMPIGLIAGTMRGWVDSVLMRIMDGLLAFPSLIIAMGLVAVLGSTLLNVIVAIGVANVPFIARVVRGQALSVREQVYVTAARSIGGSDWRVIFRHIMPNCFAPVIVQGTLEPGARRITKLKHMVPLLVPCDTRRHGMAVLRLEHLPTVLAPAAIRRTETLIQHIDVETGDAVGKLLGHDLLHYVEVAAVVTESADPVAGRIAHRELRVLAQVVPILLHHAVGNDRQLVLGRLFYRLP